MMEVIRHDININFISKFPKTAVVSLILVCLSLFGLFSKMKYGVDFRGGAEVQVKFAQQMNLDAIRTTLVKNGFKGALVQTIGEKADNEYLIKVQASDENLNEVTEKMSLLLNTTYKNEGLNIRKVDIVGPKAGANLRISGFQAMLWALIAIMIYIGLRFDFKYSPGAIVALFHDVTIILGIFAFTGTEFTLQTVAALLAVIGYSVNDTVVIYDRVREHEEKHAGRDLGEHINNAANETLSRTILTSGTTLFISVTMFIFGGGAIKDFFFAISLGVFVGTYSSIFIAAPVTLFFDRLNAGKSSSAVSA